MIFALRNYNEIFLKYALRNTIFGSDFLVNPKMINEILNILKSKTKTELILNCLIFAEFSRWSQKSLRQFLDYIIEIIRSG